MERGVGWGRSLVPKKEPSPKSSPAVAACAVRPWRLPLLPSHGVNPGREARACLVLCLGAPGVGRGSGKEMLLGHLPCQSSGIWSRLLAVDPARLRDEKPGTFGGSVQDAAERRNEAAL